jgi:hypothetical protein
VQAGNLTEVTLAHYIAIIEDAGPDHAAPKVSSKTLKAIWSR